MKRIIFCGSTLILVVFFLLPHAAHAASLYLSPSAKNLVVGQTIVVTVGVSSADQALNAVSGDISFPSSKLQVLSISKQNSIVGLWVRDPSYTNSADGGDVNFQGIVLNPGFTGSAGSVILMTLKAVATGKASLSFSTGSVLANDGNGTNILTGMTGASFTIAPAPVVVPPPALPVVVSTTAPSDTIPPEPFALNEIPASLSNPSDPQPIFQWRAVDTQSGIARYLVQVGGRGWLDASTMLVAGTDDEYQLPTQSPGEDIVLAVEAFDGAGNVALATTTFSVESPTAPMVISCALSLDISDLDSSCGLFGKVLGFALQWGTLILLLVLILALVWLAMYSIIHSLRKRHIMSSRELLRMREELRGDLRRLAKEIEGDHAAGKIKKDQIEREIEHIEDDIRKDLREIK